MPRTCVGVYVGVAQRIVEYAVRGAAAAHAQDASDAVKRLTV